MSVGPYSAPYYAPSPFVGTMQAPPTDDIELALSTITEALQGYEHAEEYDSINLWEQNMLSREGRTLRQADIEFESNLCSPVIDAVNDRLIISSVTATAGADTDTAATDAATRLVTQVWDSNELDTRYRSWNRNALRDGDAYIIVWPDQPTEPGAELSGDIDEETPASTTTGVNITYANPRGGRMFYDKENPRRKLFFAQMWEMALKGEKKPRVRMNLFYPDRIEKWISGPGNTQKTAGEFKPFIDPDLDDDNDYPGSGADPDNDPSPAAAWPMPNPYGQVPVFHLRTEYEYGDPEHKNAFAPQDALSRLIEMMMVVVEFNGFPQRYALQEADSLGTQSIREDPLADHSPADYDHDFTETALSTTSVVSGAISNETGSNYESNPGAMQIYKGFSAVGSFTTAIPGSFLEPMREFCLLISASTSTPIWKFQGLGGQTPSGEALRIAEMPLVTKVTDRMAMFGGTWRDVCEFALLLLGHRANVAVQWANPATSDLAEVWELVKLKVELGVPRVRAFMDAGISEAEAQEWSQTYSDAFALAAQEQGRALQFQANAELLQQEAMAAKIANGIPLRQVYLEAGYAQKEVDDWLSEKAAELDLSRRVALLQQVGAAIQSIGAGVSLDVLTAPGANAIIRAIIGELMPTVDLDLLELPDEEEQDGAPDPAYSGMPLPDDQTLVDPDHAAPSLLPPGSQIPGTVPAETQLLNPAAAAAQQRGTDPQLMTDSES